jgi:hypothetical protein
VDVVALGGGVGSSTMSFFNRYAKISFYNNSRPFCRYEGMREESEVKSKWVFWGITWTVRSM